MTPPPLPTAKKSVTKSNWMVIGIAVGSILLVGSLVTGAAYALPHLSEIVRRPKSGIALVLDFDAGAHRDAAAKSPEIETTAEVLRQRLRQLDLRFSVEPAAEGRLVVKVPPLNETELQVVRKTLTRTDTFEIRLVLPERHGQMTRPEDVPAGYQMMTLPRTPESGPLAEMLWVRNAPELTIDRLDGAAAASDILGEPLLIIEFTADGRNQLAELTQTLVEESKGAAHLRRMAFVIDGELCEAPTVREANTKGRIGVQGNLSHQDVADLANALNHPLPAPLHIVEEHTFGPGAGTTP